MRAPPLRSGTSDLSAADFGAGNNLWCHVRCCPSHPDSPQDCRPRRPSTPRCAADRVRLIWSLPGSCHASAGVCSGPTPRGSLDPAPGVAPRERERRAIQLACRLVHASYWRSAGDHRPLLAAVIRRRGSESCRRRASKLPHLLWNMYRSARLRSSPAPRACGFDRCIALALDATVAASIPLAPESDTLEPAAQAATLGVAGDTPRYLSGEYPGYCRSAKESPTSSGPRAAPTPSGRSPASRPSRSAKRFARMLPQTDDGATRRRFRRFSRKVSRAHVSTMMSAA